MKKIVFLTGTRADYGKLKAIMREVSISSEFFDCYIFVTGMHMLAKYGSTYSEVLAGGFGEYFTYINQNHSDSMDSVLAKTINGFSDFIKEIKPDLIVVHGDRVEALAGAIVGSLNNILVSHIEGGEVSGTVDELIRHAISKLARLHFVANKDAHRRLLQLGERAASIFTIGSPDLDIMKATNLPTLETVKKHYSIEFETYSVVLFHPVTTEIADMYEYAQNFIEALTQVTGNYVIIFPNNDLGSDEILKTYKNLAGESRFKIIPSMRFEYFLTMIKYATCMIGNSSAGVREAPFYGLPSVNIGTRQNNRSFVQSIVHSSYQVGDIVEAIYVAQKMERQIVDYKFGDGESSKRFVNILKCDEIWSLTSQKYFVDLQPVE